MEAKNLEKEKIVDKPIPIQEYLDYEENYNNLDVETITKPSQLIKGIREDNKELTTNLKKMNESMAKQAKELRENEKNLRLAANDDKMKFVDRGNYGESAYEIKEVLAKIRSESATRTIGAMFKEQVSDIVSIAAKNNIFSSSELFNAWMLFRMGGSINPDTVPEVKKISDKNFLINTNAMESMVVKSLKVYVSSLDAKLVFRKVVRMQMTSQHLYVSPFIDNFADFKMVSTFDFKYKQLYYRVVTDGTSLNKVIIYGTHIKEYNVIAAEKAWVKFAELAGLVLATSGTVDSSDDQIYSLVEFNKLETDIKRKEDQLVDISESGEVSFNVRPSDSFITDVYILNANSGDLRNYLFSVSFPLVSCFNSNVMEDSAILNRLIQTRAMRFSNYKFAIFFNSPSDAQELWEKYEEIKSILLQFTNLENALLDFVDKVDKYTLYKLSNFTTIRKIVRIVGRIFKTATIVEELMEKLPTATFNKFTAFLRDDRFSVKIKQTFWSAITEYSGDYKQACKVIGDFLYKALKGGGMIKTIQAGNVFTVDSEVVTKYFQQMYETIITYYDIKRPDLAIKSTRLIRDYISKSAKLRDSKVKQLNAIARNNQKLFVKNAVAYIDAQAEEVTNSMNAILKDNFFQNNPAVQQYARDLHGKLNEKLKKLADAKEVIETSSNITINVLINKLKPLIPGLVEAKIVDGLNKEEPMVEDSKIEVDDENSEYEYMDYEGIEPVGENPNNELTKLKKKKVAPQEKKENKNLGVKKGQKAKGTDIFGGNKRNAEPLKSRFVLVNY
jgi:hypothetical protein